MNRHLPLGVSLVLVMMSCGGGDDSSATQAQVATTTTTVAETEATSLSSTSTPTTLQQTSTSLDASSGILEEGGRVVGAYLDALGRNSFREMQALSIGPARLYAEFSEAIVRVEPLFRVDLQTTITEPPDELTALSETRYEIGGSARLKPPGSAGNVFEDFVVVQVGDEWLVETFIRDGFTLESLVFAGSEDAAVEVNNVRLWIDHGFASTQPDGSLVLTVVVTADNQRDTKQTVLGYETPFVSTATRRQFPAELLRNVAVQPDSIGQGLASFTSLDPDDLREGGRVVVKLVADACCDIWEIELPVPPLTG